MEEFSKDLVDKHASIATKLHVDFDETFPNPENQDLLQDEPDIRVYPAADLPIPSYVEESENEIVFLDPSVGEGKSLLHNKETTVPQLFAMMRQFVTPVCNNFKLIVDEMLQRGVSVNSIDSSTGMSLLHYAVRAAALTERRVLPVVRRLLDAGADPTQRCMYSGMNALHVASYFDLSSLCLLFLKPIETKPSVEVDSLCESFHFGTSLHIAASSLSCKSVEVLLQKGACHNAKDDMGRTPEQCIPENLASANEFNKANHIREMLSRHSGDSPQQIIKNKESSKPKIGSRVTFAMDISDKRGASKTIVLTGTLRFLGNIHSESEFELAGIELDTPDGVNSGNIGNSFYFNCEKNHGVFVQSSKITAVTRQQKPARKASFKLSSPETKASNIRCEFKVGDRVTFAESLTGTVRYIGQTHFASGVWCGVELDTKGRGRNNGSVGGVSYFICHPSKGIFAPPSKLSAFPCNKVSLPNQDVNESTRVKVTEKSIPSGEDESFTKRRLDSAAAVTSSKSITKRDVSSPTLHNSRSRRVYNPIASEGAPPLRPYAPKSMAYLRVGMRVDVKGTKQTAIIKFMGEADFASGVWIGLDLGAPQGRNDGSVQGRRYFSCAPNHGVMVRPAKVTYKGVSGSTMLPPHLGTDNLTLKN